jgi:hypothetical protein
MQQLVRIALNIAGQFARTLDVIGFEKIPNANLLHKDVKDYVLFSLEI